jgi:formate/nitrite transporter
MATSDAYSVYDTIELIAALGIKKSKQRIDHMIIKSFLAGVLLSFSGLFLLTVGGGGAPMDQSLGPGIHKMIQAAVFPIGLILIVITGADLFTGNTMTLVVSTLHRKTTCLNLIISWAISFFGNLAGCLFFQYIFVYYAGLLSNDPYRSFTVKFAEAKGNIEWHQIFLRGIAGNWLVCLALWLGTSARDLNSKIIGIFLPIWLFIAVGYEHSVANMFTVQMGMILGADLSVGKYISCVMIPVTLGNIFGGGFFVGFTYWYLYLAKKDDTDVISDVGSSPVNNVDQTVKQNEEVSQF